MAPQATNWARNIEFAAAELRLPASVEELQEIVAASDRVRALGSAHSFNRIADTSGVLVSTSSLPPVLDIAPDRITPRLGDSAFPPGGMSGGSTGQKNPCAASAAATISARRSSECSPI